MENFNVEKKSNTEKILNIIGLKIGEKFKFEDIIFYFDKDLELYYIKNGRPYQADIGNLILNGSYRINKLPPITDNDKEILNFYSKRGYKWFACDENGRMFAYSNYPCRGTSGFYCDDNCDGIKIAEPLSFLRWEDEPFFWEVTSDNKPDELSLNSKMIKERIESQIDFVINHNPSCDMQRGVAFGMISLAKANNQITLAESEKYNQQLETH